MDSEKKIREWAWFLRNIRAYLDSRGYLEITTPCLVEAGAFEASIDPFAVNTERSACELHTSPEIAMKAVLSEVPLPVYQIAPCFRNDPDSPIHRQEFQMLEFYLPHSSASDVLGETQALFETLAEKKLNWNIVSVERLFQNCGIEIAQNTATSDFRAAIDKKGWVVTAEDDTWNDLFFRVWIEKIEPLFSEGLTIVENYPREVSPLSLPIDGTPFAKRFEIYWRGMELCNGCSELTDPDALEKRWHVESALRKARHQAAHPFPKTLHAALKRGLPPTAGVAVGLERLFLALAQERGHQGVALL